MSTPKREVLAFNTEITELLSLLANSLYSNKEIFLRELISNSSDTLDDLRFKSLDKPELLKDDPDLKIYVTFDKQNRTITVEDNGFGMSREDIITNLGTIAYSGTKKLRNFVQSDKKSQEEFIGKFGVGFYSVFVVASKVEVFSRRADQNSECGIYWLSEGKGEYHIEDITKEGRGTKIVLYLKDEEEEFLDEFRLKSIITKYSDYIIFPILMVKSKEPDKKDEKKVLTTEIEWEQVNRAKALWRLSKDEISKEEYKEFYKQLSYDFESPLIWTHNVVEGHTKYINLLYIPKRAPFDIWSLRENRFGLKLYQDRVFIMDEASKFLPSYLRFVKGVIDCDDLSLNVSREILQSDDKTDKIRKALTKRILKLLANLAKNEPEKYLTFWQELGKILKEGISEDFKNRIEIASLLRFSSTYNNSSAQNVSFDDYLTRMKKGQEQIYYLTADTFAKAYNSPHLEIFKKKEIEVLLLFDKIDEWLVVNLNEFKEKKLTSIMRGKIDLGNIEGAEKKENDNNLQTKANYDNLIDRIAKVLKGRIKEVRLTERLTQSPVCIVVDSDDMSLNLQRILKTAGQQTQDVLPIFEINPDHKIIHILNGEKESKEFAKWVEILFNQAILVEGGQLENPSDFVTKINQLLVDLI